MTLKKVFRADVTNAFWVELAATDLLCLRHLLNGIDDLVHF